LANLLAVWLAVILVGGECLPRKSSGQNDEDENRYFVFHVILFVVCFFVLSSNSHFGNEPVQSR
jgi:hypothetical protein